MGIATPVRKSVPAKAPKGSNTDECRQAMTAKGDAIHPATAAQRAQLGAAIRQGQYQRRQVMRLLGSANSPLVLATAKSLTNWRDVLLKSKTYKTFSKNMRKAAKNVGRNWNG